MVHPRDAHVGTPPSPTLLDSLGGHIKYAHERYWAAGHPIVERTKSFFGRRRLKLKPVPPPDW